MTLVSLQEARQDGQQPPAGASRKRPAPEQQPERESRRPRRAYRREEAHDSADGAAGAEPPAAAAAAAALAATRPANPGAAAQRAAQAAARVAEAERRGGELAEAYQVFQEQAKQRLMFMEVDAGKLSPRRLEGRTVRVYWPGDDAWYLGQVKSYCEATGKHKVHYADGERQEEVLALERVRLLVHAGEELPLASGSSLAATMGVLRRLLQGSEFARDPGRKRLLQQRLEELTAYAKRRYGEQVFEEEMLRSVTLASSPGFAAATVHTSARSGAGCRGAGATSGGRVSCGGSGGAEAIHRALALATQLPANIKINSAKPPDATRHTWTLKINILGRHAWFGGLKREQAAVGSDLLTVWRKDRVEAGGTVQGKQLSELLLSAAGYERDAVLMQQLRQASTAPEMKALLERLLLQTDSSGQAQHHVPDQQQQAQQQAPALQLEAQQQQQQQAAGRQQQQPEATVEPLVAADFAMASEEEEEGVAEHEPPPQAASAAAGAAADADLQLDAEMRDQEAQAYAEAEAAALAASAGPADGSDLAAAAGQGEGGPESAAAAASKPAPPPQLRVGEVGWFQVRGYPHWPFLVITREEAVARGLPAVHLKNPAYLPVQYFGTAEVSGVNPAAVEKGASKRRAGSGARCFGAFLDGLERGWHAPQQCKKANQFRVALAELETYFKEGNLPPSMVSKNNTDGEADEEEQQEAEAEQEAAAKPAAKRRKSQAKAGGAANADDDSGPLGLPLQLNKTLSVVALGEVEWLHPAFHNEKAIFPPGYCAERLTSTPASGKQEVVHVMEVCRAPNGSGPLFRVTPRGFPPVQGPTATKAWQALYASDEDGAARSLNLSGEMMFGLSNPKVQRAIRALPGAQRCERYCGWPEGQQPVPIPLTPREQRERLACEARMQQLPDGIEPQPGPQRPPGICHVCDEEDETDLNLVLKCGNCHLFVHMNCYGVAEPPNGQLWLCDVCTLGLSAPPPCVLCPVAGGALRRTSCGRWAHVVCCDYVPETHLDPDRGIIDGVSKVHRSRFHLTCQVCKQRHGACTQCCEPRCCIGFHPLCARRAGHRMERVEDSDCEDDELEDEEVEGAQQPSAGQAARLPAGQEGSCDENDAAAPNGNSKRRGGRGRANRGGSKGRRSRQQEGVALDDGSRLLAYCRKHSQGASAAAGGLPLGQLQQQSSGAAAAAAAAAARASLPPLGSDAQPVAQQAGQQQQAQQQAAAPAPPPAPMVNPWGSARAAPFNPAARRGSRAPEAVAAAEAKRGYVLSQPYLAGGLRRHELVPSSGREQWRPADVPPSGRRALPPNAVVGQVHSLALPADKPGTEAAPPPPQPQQGAAPPPQGVQQQRQQVDGNATSPPPLRASRRAASGLGSPLAGVPHLATSPRASFKSDLERYREMVATQGQRVTIGKSGIHGWGAFAKTRHAKHTMVIEYVGELVRESVVTEVREKRWYNDMVGAGTYVFRLGGDSTLCVDATRAGNLAHMLNHSCAPNCYSRTLRFVEDGRAVDRVIIYAARDIEPWEELTYDYRFGGEEQLHCNCGAPTCRGHVNEKPPNWGEQWVPRSQLRPFIKPPKSGVESAAAERQEPPAETQQPAAAERQEPPAETQQPAAAEPQAVRQAATEQQPVAAGQPMAAAQQPAEAGKPVALEAAGAVDGVLQEQPQGLPQAQQVQPLEAAAQEQQQQQQQTLADPQPLLVVQQLDQPVGKLAAQQDEPQWFGEALAALQPTAGVPQVGQAGLQPTAGVPQVGQAGLQPTAGVPQVGQAGLQYCALPMPMPMPEQTAAAAAQQGLPPAPLLWPHFS